MRHHGEGKRALENTILAGLPLAKLISILRLRPTARLASITRPAAARARTGGAVSASGASSGSHSSGQRHCVDGFGTRVCTVAGLLTGRVTIAPVHRATHAVLLRPSAAPRVVEHRHRGHRPGPERRQAHHARYRTGPSATRPNWRANRSTAWPSSPSVGGLVISPSTAPENSASASTCRASASDSAHAAAAFLRRQPAALRHRTRAGPESRFERASVRRGRIRNRWVEGARFRSWGTFAEGGTQLHEGTPTTPHSALSARASGANRPRFAGNPLPQRHDAAGLPQARLAQACRRLRAAQDLARRIRISRRLATWRRASTPNLGEQASKTSASHGQGSRFWDGTCHDSRCVQPHPRPIGVRNSRTAEAP